MEFQKNTTKFSFGAGSLKVAGKGKVSESQMYAKAKPDKNKIIKTVALTLVSAFMFLTKIKKKKR